MKRVAIGRKNWLFAGNDRAGETTALLYSPIAGAERHGVDPQRYLTSLFAQLPFTSGEELDQFLPDIWKLGWNRNGWLSEFEERENELHVFFPEAQLFQVVMTGSNWPGFGTDERIGKQFFVLLDDIRNLETLDECNIVHPIEALVQAIHLHAGA